MGDGGGCCRVGWAVKQASLNLWMFPWLPRGRPPPRCMLHWQRQTCFPEKIPCLYGRSGMICDGRDERYPQISEMPTKECWSSVTRSWGTLRVYAGSNCWPTTVLSLTSHQLLHLATTTCLFCFTIFQNPDNVIFVMDATIGQACESQVNFMFLTALI